MEKIIEKVDNDIHECDLSIGKLKVRRNIKILTLGAFVLSTVGGGYRLIRNHPDANFSLVLLNAWISILNTISLYEDISNLKDLKEAKKIFENLKERYEFGQSKHKSK